MPTRGSYPPGFLKTGRVDMPPPPVTKPAKPKKRHYNRAAPNRERVLATNLNIAYVPAAPVRVHSAPQMSVCPCCEGLGQIGSSDSQRLEIDGFVYDRKLVTYGGKDLGFSATMSKFLVALMSAPGMVISKQGLHAYVYGDGSDIEIKIIDVYICKLRRAIFNGTGLQPIQTVWSRGYVWKLPPEELKTA